MIFTPVMLQNNQLWFNYLRICYQREGELKKKGTIQNNIQSTLVDPSDPDVYFVIYCMINLIFDYIVIIIIIIRQPTGLPISDSTLLKGNILI